MTVEWLICREPVHIGGADSSSRGNNNPIFRLPDRTPAIPGSSLRGALREGAERHENKNIQEQVKIWFGGQDKAPDDQISPGYISLGWGWPVWWPVYVLGYGNWWISCPAWLNRFRQFSSESPLNLSGNSVYITDESLKGKTVYLRWVKLTDVKSIEPGKLPAPDEIPAKKRIIVPDEKINLMVDMGLIRQPRVSLREEPDDGGSLVQNLFAVEGLPPKAAFVITWEIRDRNKVNSENQELWEKFLRDEEHFLGGLWSVGYGRIKISAIS